MQRAGICLRCHGNDDDNDSDDSDTWCNDDTLSRCYYRVTLYNMSCDNHVSMICNYVNTPDNGA